MSGNRPASARARRLPGVNVLRAERTRTLLALEPGGNDQTVLRAALATGPVREFRWDAPRLSWRDALRLGADRAPVG